MKYSLAHKKYQKKGWKSPRKMWWLRDSNKKIVLNLGYISISDARVIRDQYNRGLLKPDINTETFNSLIDKFTPYFKSKIGTLYSESTFNKYSMHLNIITDYFGLMLVKDIKKRHIESFKLYLIENYSFSNRYKNHHLTEISRILDYAIDEEIIDYKPIISRFTESGLSKETPIATESEFQLLIEEASNRNLTDLVLYINLMYYTAMRPQEAVSLLWNDVSFEKDIVMIRSKDKNKPGGPIPLLSKLKEILLDIKPTSPFVSPYRTSNDAYRELKSVSKSIGLNIYPKMIRKSVNSILFSKGVDLAIITKYLRHKSPNVNYKHYLNIETELTKERIENKL